MSKNLKKIILFLVIVVITVGIASATNSTDTTTQHQITNHEHDTTAVNINNQTNPIKKTITKNANTTTKEATNTYTTTANNYNELVNKVNQAKNTNYDTYTINLKKGTYNATTTINWNNTKGTKKLIINGNQAKLNGEKCTYLMQIGKNYEVTLNKIKISNFDNKIEYSYRNNCTIYSEGVLTVNNCEFINNTSWSGGAISSKGTLTINNSKFTNNKAEYGGAIYSEYGKLIINNSKFTNNKASTGGAIYSYIGKATITNSEFTRNTAQYSSGVIYTCDGTLSIYNSTFSSNTAASGGVMTTSCRTVTTINNSKFNNNRANFFGGALNLDDDISTTINNCELTNNTADHGGAIIIYSPILITITKTTFTNNTANSKGGAINIDNGKITIKNSVFNKNAADIGKSLYLERANIDSRNNNFTGKYSQEIKLNGGNLTINNNYFNNEKISKKLSNLQINVYLSNSDILIGAPVNICGYVIGDKDIVGKEVIIKVNNETFTTKTDENSYYSLDYKTKKIGKNKVTVTYKKTKEYDSNSITDEFNAKNPVNIIIYKIPVATKGEVSKISGKLLSNNKGIKGATVTIDVNGKIFTTKTYSSGYFKINYTVPTFNQRTVKISYNGSSIYLSATNKTTFKVKQKTKINILTKGNVNSGKTVKISGQLRLTDNKGVKAQTVTITVGSKKYTTKTYSSGYFTIDHIFDNSKSKITVNVAFNGSTNYLASNATTTLTIVKT